MALDVGIAKIGIFCFVFLIAFGGILALMPSGFSPETLKDYSDLSSKIPDEWNGVSLEGYNFTETWNVTLISFHSANEYFTIGNRPLCLYYSHSFGGVVRLFYTYGLGLLFHDDMQWFNSKNERVSYFGWSGNNVEVFDTDHMNEQYEQEETVFKVLCLGKGGAWLLGSSSYFYVTAILSFNITAYDTPLEAWDNNDLNVLIGINPQNANLSRDIWFMVTSILAFNTVEIFGTNTPNTWQYILNYIISGAIWAGILIFAGVIALEIWTAIFPL